MNDLNQKENYTLEQLGYNQKIQNIISAESNDFQIARVIKAHKERYIVLNNENEYEAEITGNLRFSAKSITDFPVVGDWVAISEFDENKAIIHQVYSRINLIKRLSPDKESEIQAIASNINYAFIIQSVDRDFSLNRFERYISICLEEKIEPILILNKIDLITENDLIKLKSEIETRLGKFLLFTISCELNQGLDLIKKTMKDGFTYCLLGSSGVGKSTFINSLLKEEALKTSEISSSTDRGKHTTTHRELIVTKGFGLIIDNPGMREVGMSNSKEGIENTFDKISELAKECKYTDCSHINESGCAVLKALDEGLLSQDVYENYQKLIREQDHFLASEAEKRQKGKDFAKMIKQVKKQKPWR